MLLMVFNVTLMVFSLVKLGDFIYNVHEIKHISFGLSTNESIRYYRLGTRM